MFSFKATPDEGEPFQVEAQARDVVQWEKTTKGAAFADISNRMHMTHMYKIAFIAATRQNLYVGTLADFEKNVELEFQEDDEPDPTRPTP